MKAIIFDCFGVFVDDSFRQRVNDLSYTNPDVGLKARDINRATDRGFMGQKESIEELSNLLGVGLNELRDMQLEGEVLNLKLIEFARSLRPKLKLAMLSNVSGRDYLVQKFASENIDSIFDVVVASGDEGVAKPDARIYEITASRLGVRPEDCVMVDDILEFCQAAEMVGMRSVHFTSTEQGMNDIALLIDSSETRY